MTKLLHESISIKHQVLVRQLAAELILREPGQQLPTVSELAARFNVGYGTVQRALRTLETLGAVRLESRGHLGTYILEKDLRRLWEAAGTPTLLGGFPLPTTRRIQALATALQQEFRRVRVPTELVYLQGSRKRLGQLRQGRLDFIIVSRFAAERAWDNQHDVSIVYSFGTATYHNPEALRLVYRTLPPQRIGVDRRSCDHYWRTLELFPESEHLFINLPYPSIPEALAREEIDAALWYIDAPPPFPWPETIHLSPVLPSPLDDKISEACLVILATNVLLREFIIQQIDYETIQQSRVSVLSQERLPLF